jgi:hypothetical protein
MIIPEYCMNLVNPVIAICWSNAGRELHRHNEPQSSNSRCDGGYIS